MSIKIQVNSFNAGEMSPLLAARADLPKFRTGCRVMTNTLPRMFGGAFSRPGMVYRGEVGFSDQKARLFDFDFSANTRFMLEFQPNALRFWRNGELVTADVAGAPVWTSSSTGGPDFYFKYVGNGSDIVYDGADRRFYAAKATHTPAVDNEPPSSFWGTSPVRKWLTGTAYVIGELVYYYNSGSGLEGVFMAKTSHTSSGTPDADATNYAPLWHYDGANYSKNWTTGEAYVVGEKIVNYFQTGSGASLKTVVKAYRCTVAHTSGASTEPGVGASWATRWVEVTATPNHSTASVSYYIGDLVKVGSVVYIATSAHTSSASNEPTDPGSPWAVVPNAVPWITASTARTNGQWFMIGGEFFMCVKDHTSATTFTTSLGSTVYFKNQVFSLATQWLPKDVYEVGDIVSDGAFYYQCVQFHTVDAAKEPGTSGGADYWQALSNVGAWASGSLYSKGQIIIQSGASYRCLVAHTSGTFATDLAAGYWVAADYPLTIGTPYTESELFDFQGCQVNNWVYLTHPDHPVYKLVRVSDDVWTMGRVVWTFPALTDENITDTTVAVGATTLGTSTTLTASTNILTQIMVGSMFSLSHYRDDALVSLTFTTGTVTSSSLRVVSGWELTTYGVWTGNLFLERSDDNGSTWQVIRQYEGKNDHNIIDSGTLDGEALLRTRYVNASGTPATNPRAIIRVIDTKIAGLVRIDAVTSSKTANVTVIKSPWGTAATKYWAKEAWSAEDGYPRTVCLHEQRLWFGGNKKQPRMVWGSVIGDFEHFQRSTLDDAALAYQVEGKANAVQWLASQSGNLLIGTSGDEAILGSGSQDSPITPTLVQAKVQGQNGSAYLPAIQVNEVTLFVERDGRTLREFVYAFEKDGFIAQRMTLLAEHITRGVVKQMSLQSKPDIIVWVVTQDGQLIGMTYERAQDVVAWHKHVTDGTVESVAVIGGEVGAADEVWMVVNRTIEGQTRRYVERFDPFHWQKVEQSNLSYYAGLDSCRIVETAGAITGLDHLEGETVTVLLDGETIETHTVAGGTVTPVAAHAVAVVGLPFLPYFEPNDFSIDMQDGTSVGRYQRISRVQFEMWNTAAGMQTRHDAVGDWEDVIFTDDPTDEQPATYSGKREVILDGQHNREMHLAVRQNKPLPMNVLAMVIKPDVNGD